MMTLSGKVALVTGASRGIGRAIALRLAREGAKLGLLGKTIEPHSKLPGTLIETAKEIDGLGGESLILECDVRDELKLISSVQSLAEKFGAIDILVNNAGAIHLANVETVAVRKIDLMYQVNLRASLIAAQSCLPFLKRSKNPHILNLSPPLSLNPKWLKDFAAYSITKFGMSLAVLGMAEEFREFGIAVNALWPRTTIATAAIYNLLGGEEVANRSRTPEIVAEAAYKIFLKDSKNFSGNLLIDEEFLREEGIQNFDAYAVDPTQSLQLDFYIED